MTHCLTEEGTPSILAHFPSERRSKRSIVNGRVYKRNGTGREPQPKEESAGRPEIGQCLILHHSRLYSMSLSRRILSRFQCDRRSKRDAEKRERRGDGLHKRKRTVKEGLIGLSLRLHFSIQLECSARREKKCPVRMRGAPFKLSVRHGRIICMCVIHI